MANFFSRFTRSSPSRPEQRTKSLSLNWILQGELAVGPIPLEEERQLIISEAGIRSILTLCSESEGTPPEAVRTERKWRRVPLQDSHSDALLSVVNLTCAVDQAHDFIQSFAPLYVHCVAGMERSPSVCVGYLYKYRGMQLWEALNWVKQANPRTNILDSQLKAIQQLK